MQLFKVWVRINQDLVSWIVSAKDEDEAERMADDCVAWSSTEQEWLDSYITSVEKIA